ncbi:unnamed protein product [Paramecium sonneborni]|uniref:Uncharacterized protein n=1 Tax=Paramecium sonneborni TaxID=65129 RepID=A0A8S1LSF1_9CILI|nr:unnamed protein product [Paramecium sonneborni]
MELFFYFFNSQSRRQKQIILVTLYIIFLFIKISRALNDEKQNHPKLIGSRFDFQSAAERGLSQKEHITKLINPIEPDIALPQFILPNHNNKQNLSVQLTRKINSESHSPDQQSKVLDEFQMTKLIFPQQDIKIQATQDNQLNINKPIQFQELSDENLGFYHNFLHEQSTEQYIEQKQILRQNTYQQNQFYLNQSPRKRQFSFQINQNFKSYLDVTNERDNSFEVDEDISNILKNNNSQSKDIKQVEDQLIQNIDPQMKQTIMKLKTQEKIHFKVKKIKVGFLLVRAIIKMIILVRPLKQQWIQKQKIFSQLFKLFKFKDKLIQNKIKQWTQISLTKVFSVLRYQTLKQWNFIECNLEDYQKDLAITNFLNLCSHLISNLEITTQPASFLTELGYQSYLEQFVEYRQTYNVFVSKRTNYLSNKYSNITMKEKAMIATECVIMNNFIPNLVLLTENKKFFNSDDQNIQFLIRGFITILQQLFIMTFQDIPEVQRLNSQLQYQQMQIGRNKQGMILVPIKTDMEEFYKGTFKIDQFKLIFERKFWFQNLLKKFKKVVQNIYQNKIQDL